MRTSPIKVGLLSGSIAAALLGSPLFAAQPTATPAKPDVQPNHNWSDRISDEFQQMQRNMERIFSDATHEFNQQGDWFEHGGFSSSVKTTEDHDNYIVHVYLPDRDLQKVDAKLDGQTLRITANEEKRADTTSAAKPGDKGSAPSVYEVGRYEQLLTLPGPVDGAKMKIDRSGSSLTITLPKVNPTQPSTGNG